MTKFTMLRLLTAFLVSFGLFIPKSVFCGVDVDVRTGLTLGSRIGLFASLYQTNIDPTAVQDQPGRRGTQYNLIPSIAISLATRRTVIDASYQLRLSNNINQDSSYRLNIVHSCVLQLSSKLSPSTTFSGNGNFRYSLVDYSTARILFDPESQLAANPPAVDELRYYSAGSTFGVTKQFSPISSGTLSIIYRTRRSLELQGTEDAPFSDQDQGTLRLNYSRQLSPDSVLTADASGQLVANRPGANFVSALTSGGLTHTFRTNTNLSLSAGLIVAYLASINFEDTSSDITESGPKPIFMFPIGNLSVQQVFPLRKQRSINLGVFGSSTQYYDQVTTTVKQQLRFGLSVSAVITPSWRINLRGNISTLRTPSPIQQSIDFEITPVEYPTGSLIDVSAVYRASNEVFIRLGFNTSSRWSHIWDSDFRARAFEEYTFYLLITSNQKFLDE